MIKPLLPWYFMSACRLLIESIGIWIRGEFVSGIYSLGFDWVENSVFILNYFRSAATNISHIRSEHGMRDTNGSGLERNLLFGDPGGGPGLREGALPLSYSLE